MHFEHDIPGVWTSVFHWLSCMFFISLYPQRVKDALLWFLSGLLLLLQTVLYIAFVAGRAGVYFNIMTAVFALWTLLPFLVFSEGPILNKVYACARAFILGAFAVSLAWQLYAFGASTVPSLSGFAAETFFMLTMAAIVFTLAYILERGHIRENAEMRITPQAAVTVVVLAFVIYVLSSLSYGSYNVPFTASREAEIFAIRTLVYFGGVSMMFATHVQLCDAYSELERRALQSVLEAQYQNYRASQDSINIVNQKYHDLKHQIALLRSELGSEKKLEYLDQVEQEISAYEAQNKTGNEVLDTILTSKSLYCMEHNIVFTCVADGHALDFMSVMDLTSMFGNAVDNAIESVSQIEEPEKRLIHLSVARQRSFVSIMVRNRFKDEPVIYGGIPVTTKADRENHGYGIKSIKNAAEKYGGTASVRVNEGWFELSILMPVKTK
ncbi:MAG: GHKL domain-containing protein [Oscillospiraceae bacterium]|nr:GHKL domain-containing protein [Oscillospiraceae bacterium]